MKRTIRAGIAVITIIISLLILFYFWGSSPNLDKIEYAKIIEYAPAQLGNRTDTFEILTYNIGYLSGLNNNIAIKSSRNLYEQNLENVQEVMRNFNPSFIAFQEIDFYSKRSYFNNQMDSIANYAGYQNGAVAVNWDKKYVPFPYWPPSVHFGRMLSGQGILSQLPITLNKRIVLPKPPSNPFYYNAFYIDRLVQITEVAINDVTLAIINVHLEAYDKSHREFQSNLLKDMVLEYVNRMPLLVVGDFNSHPPYAGNDSKPESTIQTLLEISGLVAAITEEVFLKDPQRYMTYRSDCLHAKIDYIFYNSGFIEKIEAGTLKNTYTASDHLPVYMKFILKNNSNTF